MSLRLDSSYFLSDVNTEEGELERESNPAEDETSLYIVIQKFELLQLLTRFADRNMFSM